MYDYDLFLSDNVPCIAEYLHQMYLLFCNLNTQSNTLAGDLLLPLLRVVSYPIYRQHSYRHHHVNMRSERRLMLVPLMSERNLSRLDPSGSSNSLLAIYSERNQSGAINHQDRFHHYLCGANKDKGSRSQSHNYRLCKWSGDFGDEYAK